MNTYRVSNLFRNDDCFQRTIRARGIPLAYIGMKVQFDSNDRGFLSGVICGANYSQNLDVCFEGTSYTENCHPHYKLSYFDKDGKIVYRFQ